MNQIGLGNMVIDNAHKVTIKDFSCAVKNFEASYFRKEKVEFETLLKSITEKGSKADKKKKKTGRKPRNRLENLPEGGSMHRDGKKRDETVRKGGEKGEDLHAGGSSRQV